MPLLELLESIRNPVFDFFFSLITHLGEETFFLIIALVIYWCIDKKLGYYILFVGFFGTIVNQFLKLSFRIPRPWILNPDFTIVESARAAATGYSFPSGHTQCVVGTFGCIGLYFRKKKAILISSVAVLLLVSFSRLYLGVHTPLDVSVSFLIAVALVAGIYPLIKKWNDNNVFIYILSCVMILFSVSLFVYANVYPFPADIDLNNLASGVKTSCSLFGAALALPFMLILDEKYIHYDTKAAFWVQILKAVSGLALVLLVKEGLKIPFDAIFGAESSVSRIIRYFCVVITAGVLCPLLFRLYTKFGKKKEEEKQDA